MISFKRGLESMINQSIKKSTVMKNLGEFQIKSMVYE